MPKDPWTDPNPEPGDFDQGAEATNDAEVEHHPGHTEARLRVVADSDAQLQARAAAIDAAIGFWSYARTDEENSGGRLGSLAAHIRREFTLITGDELHLFVDRNIAWGQEWKRRIDEELQAVTFLIPVVTPAFFKSQACRDELLKFSGHAKSLGLEDLVLPIYYVEVPALTEYVAGSDPVIDLIHERQWEDWRTLRLLASDDPKYLEAIAKVAHRLSEIASQAETASVQLSVTVDQEGDQEPGYLDLLAQGEIALPRWTQTLEDFGAQMVRLGEQAEAGGSEMQASDLKGAGFAGRLSVARKLARELEPTAESMQALSSSYSDDLVRFDPMVLTLVRLAKEDDATGKEEGVLEFFEAVMGIVGASRTAGNELRGLLEAIDTPSKFSRDLRVPLDKVRIALRSILDGQAVMDEWERQIDGLRQSSSLS